MKRVPTILGVVLVAAAGGAAAYYWRERQTLEPRYKLLRADKRFELREYPALTVASVTAEGDRDRALGSGFRRLADYIFAEDREGEEIPMTAPVLQDRDSDRGPSAWRTRFVMPQGCEKATLPTPDVGITLEDIPARRLAAIRFGGSPNDADLRRREDELRHWLEQERLQPIGGFEYAFYNSPMIPGPLRRNEVLVPVSAG